MSDDLSTDPFAQDPNDPHDGAPASISLAEELLKEAIARQAAEIHLDPTDDGLLIRFRTDGRLQTRSTEHKALHASMIGRLKNLAHCDIAERHRPQDGRFDVRLGDRTVAMHASFMPTRCGERLVLRLLDAGTGPTGIDDLGLERRQSEELLTAARARKGLILLGGRSNSGRKTTAYAMLEAIRSPECNLITIESTFLRKLPGIAQCVANPVADFTFALALRQAERQGVDGMFVEEIADAETAAMCLNAASAGRLILTTLHVDSAAAALQRLRDMGFEDWRIVDAVSAFAAQRLVRVLCESCKVAEKPDEEDPRMRACMDATSSLPKELVPPRPWTWYRASGCPACGQQGYKGRTAIAEVYRIDASMRRAVCAGRDGADIDSVARSGGRWDLRASGWLKVIQGKTTPEELQAVV